MAQDGYNLIKEAQAGNKDAFEVLVKKYDRKVLTLALRYTRSEEDAKDIYQEVFIRVYRSLPKFEFKSEFSTWLFRIATNVCLTHVERTGKHQTVDALESINPDDEESAPALQIVSNDLNPEQNLRNMELKAGIQKAVEQLTGKQKLVFTMKHFEGYKLREIADITGLNEGTVKRYLFDATIKMKNALRHFYN
ncbi:MAG: RNA polymerase sigma factor [Ignavibacteriales bacterium]|jgi:RNA polymerase sigma-70 factor (ECF subfamily)|nr:RNA polymerase sigma factor [Ignavibacteriales bacterium]MBP7542292.1 RNA polymerase sigma factor [Ignavibacteriaceae bacterium]MBP9123664.1 RNA polymerase sigma factor [Ignavibacteriaceae bacterium]